MNPTREQAEVSDMDVTVVSTGKKVVMIEAGPPGLPDVLVVGVHGGLGLVHKVGDDIVGTSRWAAPRRASPPFRWI